MGEQHFSAEYTSEFSSMTKMLSSSPQASSSFALD